MPSCLQLQHAVCSSWLGLCCYVTLHSLRCVCVDFGNFSGRTNTQNLHPISVLCNWQLKNSLLYAVRSVWVESHLCTVVEDRVYIPDRPLLVQDRGSLTARLLWAG